MEVLIDRTILPRPVRVADPEPSAAMNQGTTAVCPPCKSERRSSSLLSPSAVAATTTRSTFSQSNESTRVASVRLRMKLFKFFQMRYHFCPVAVRLLSVAVTRLHHKAVVKLLLASEPAVLSNLLLADGQMAATGKIYQPGWCERHT